MEKDAATRQILTDPETETQATEEERFPRSKLFQESAKKVAKNCQKAKSEVHFFEG